MEYKIQKVKLKDVCKIEKGKIGITKAVKGEYPLVVTAEERLSHNEWHFNEPATIVPLVSSTGHGHASIKRLHYADGKYAVGNILATLIPIDHDYLNAKYLYVYLTINKEELLVSQMTGAANVTLTLTRLADVEIEIPDYATQLKVINRYEDSENFKNQMGSQIEVRSQLIENLRQQILNDAITGKLSEKWRRDNLGDVITDIGTGWKICRLFEVADFFNGKAHEPIVSENGKFILINSKFVSNSGDTKIKMVTERLTPLQSGDIAFVMSDVPGGRALARTYLVERDDKYSLNQRICGFKAKSCILPAFLNVILNRNDYFLSFDDGKKQTNLRKDQIIQFEFSLPSISEQHYIVEGIKSLFIKIDRINQINNENLTMVDLLNKVSLKELFGN
ncbi:MAG TPA: restriction endonuclease subunit S [Candidatus Dojkabacteria bacterium]|nr:restriction endonuclease subunit S [Candidatus Dojkabacteria bacterium]HRO64937.1 restriction endonuclease subunit S [Candidatus Dojkabacteria bacterium]HRP51333.1 restriction endonuclease subunit S [Candidatus Dojkabacteria bacterium]